MSTGVYGSTAIWYATAPATVERDWSSGAVEKGLRLAAIRAKRGSKSRRSRVL